MFVFRALLLVFVFGSLSFSENLIIETYGDSLTAGFLADTSLTEPRPLTELSKTLQELAFAFLQKDRATLQKFESNQHAWPHYFSESLKKEGFAVDQVINLAISGSKSSQIPAQVKTRGKGIAPTWAFFFVGHNDLCHVKGDAEVIAEQFRTHLNESLVEWEKNHEGSTAFLIPAGPIYQLYPVLENYVWFESSQKTFKCQDAWVRYFPYCVHFYQRHKRGELESYLKPRTEAINKSLEEIAKDWEKKSSGRNRYRFIEAQWPSPLEPQLFAMDCYHIASPGQKIFAENVLSAVLRSMPTR